MREYVEKFAVDHENVWKLFNHMNDGLIIANSKRQIIAANPAFQKITGYDYEELFLKNPRILQSGRTPPSIFKEMWESITKSGTWTGELINRRKNGKHYWSFITITEIKKKNTKDTYYIGIIRDITTRKLDEEKISYLAFNDHLTGLPNRVRFKQLLTEQIKHHKKTHEQLAVIFFDLDRFKIINDTFGHHHGDEILKGVAARLKEIIGNSGIVGRFGSDEFIIMLPYIQSIKPITDVTAKIFKKFTELPIRCTGRELFITTSMGISLYPEHGHDTNTLIKNADIAMYSSKDEGRNNYHFYEPTMSESKYEQLAIETDLHRALENDEFKVFYQLQIDVETKRPYGVEALIRWFHPERGLVAPNEFLAVAEEMGLIIEIDDWVMKKACEQVKKWNDQGANLQLSVNISRKQFERNRFVDVVKKTIRETGIHPNQLMLEITENMAIINVEAAIQKLQTLKDLGVHFSLDDFGTGYSSLSQLKRFPIDTLKIDQSFVKNSNGNDKDAAIVKLIIAMAKTLNFTVTCEGVETEEQFALIKREGCDHAQGYLFSKPIEGEKVEQLFLGASF